MNHLYLLSMLFGYKRRPDPASPSSDFASTGVPTSPATVSPLGLTFTYVLLPVLLPVTIFYITQQRSEKIVEYFRAFKDSFHNIRVAKALANALREDTQ
jgi:hypothetical protein